MFRPETVDNFSENKENDNTILYKMGSSLEKHSLVAMKTKKHDQQRLSWKFSN